MALRRALAGWLARRVVRPSLAPRLPLAARRRRTERAAGLLPLPRGVRQVPAGEENPGGAWLLPPGVHADCPRGAVLYVHGGGFVLGSTISHRGIAAWLARSTGLPVLLAHYRLAPEHPFPAGLEDLQSAWQRLSLDGARPVGLAGDSAGGWLALALVAYAAGAGLPAPSGLALFSPLVDLAEAERDGDADTDTLLPAGFVTEGVRAWRGGIPAGDPRFDLLGALGAGWPPLFVAFDRDELLAPGARRLVAAARAGGGPVRVEETVGLWHVWPMFAALMPEARATLRAAAAMLVPAPGARD